MVKIFYFDSLFHLFDENGSQTEEIHTDWRNLYVLDWDSTIFLTNVSHFQT